MRRPLLASLSLAALSASVLAVVAVPATASTRSHALPLGPSSLREQRETRQLAPGVTLTSIVRGEKSPEDVWTLHVRLSVPGNASAVIAPKATADDAAHRLEAAGLHPRVEAVDGPRFADVRPGRVGYVVRVGRYATEADAKKDLPALTAAGFSAGTSYTAQDGAEATGPWRLHVITVDPRRFSGRVVSSVGGTLTATDKVSDLVRTSGAVAGVNGTYFTSAGKGGSAGLHVLDGELTSEANNGRTAMILPRSGRGVRFAQLSTELRVRAQDRATRELDGVDRLPGLVDNCGGVGGDQPTERPQHDVTCTDPDELVAFTPVYGASSPAGAGVEAVLDGSGRVTDLRESRGTAIPAGGRTVQAIGTAADWLRSHARPGTRLAISERVLDRGRPVRLAPGTSILGAGPQLVRDGRVWVDAYADGLVHTGDDQSFYYNWVLRRNPRTMVGVDRLGRLLMVAADGRAPGYSEGLSIEEAAKVMRSLGAVQAMNFDGGGSTTMAAAGGALVNRPSDATGERSVGDGILLLPGRG
ncbi:phosphodiester glycosidase family protein [Actinomadura opuntiae]|uniref:phosphodiester glycosidase family protein n=1 Tax=Actinomadura sp. OS1-43 TaxID=604315 RepID=UPI00255B1CEE|nr:phosphodiester glycosidase family protein [Actinomadura sp. OS1-43]MDL4814327.1 phosphodiester glycosidase family protein [Actinomadura sp. OS1-43]